MLAQLQDLDNMAAALNSDVAAGLAARRAAWADMTAQQRRKLARAATREFREWLEDRREHGHGKPA